MLPLISTASLDRQWNASQPVHATATRSVSRPVQSLFFVNPCISPGTVSPRCGGWDSVSDDNQPNRLTEANLGMEEELVAFSSTNRNHSATLQPAFTLLSDQLELIIYFRQPSIRRFRGLLPSPQKTLKMSKIPPCRRWRCALSFPSLP